MKQRHSLAMIEQPTFSVRTAA